MDDDLGACLRAWRDRLSPADVGLPRTSRRRAPGLRRQEVAALAGVSVEYLARLEQSRAHHPSASVLGPLARALRLSDAERNHLLVLAGHAPDAPRVAPHITPGLQRILDRLADTPVHVVDDAFQVVHANALARALLGEEYVAEGANVARDQFLGTASRVLDEDDHDARFRAQIAAQLRQALATSAQPERVKAIVDELHAASPVFAELWARGELRTVRTSRKAIQHPDVGRIEVDCDVLRADDSSLRLVVYTVAAGSPAAGALALLRTIGTQRIGAGPERMASQPPAA
jgi:transcriptional regulator with XRE-family HTH domain